MYLKKKKINFIMFFIMLLYILSFRQRDRQHWPNACKFSSETEKTQLNTHRATVKDFLEKLKIFWLFLGVKSSKIENEKFRECPSAKKGYKHKLLWCFAKSRQLLQTRFSWIDFLETAELIDWKFQGLIQLMFGYCS